MNEEILNIRFVSFLKR